MDEKQVRMVMGNFLVLKELKQTERSFATLRMTIQPCSHPERSEGSLYVEQIFIFTLSDPKLLIDRSVLCSSPKIHGEIPETAPPGWPGEPVA